MVLAAASPPQKKAERSGKQGSRPRQPNQALRRRSRAQRQAGVLRSVQRSTTSAATTRNAFRGMRACICFQHSAFTARGATQRAALHSAQHYTAHSTTQRAALHSAQRYTAPSATHRPWLHCAQRYTSRSVVQCAVLYSAPLPPSITQRPALHCTEHSEPRQGRSQQANQAGCAKGVCCVFFVRLAPMKTVVRTPELAPCA